MRGLEDLPSDDELIVPDDDAPKTPGEIEYIGGPGMSEESIEDHKDVSDRYEPESLKNQRSIPIKKEKSGKLDSKVGNKFIEHEDDIHSHSGSEDDITTKKHANVN